MIQLKPNQPIIIEGIHGLNDRVSSSVPREEKFKIYVSSLTPLYMNEEVRLSTTQARLFRRIVRDYRTRGTSAAETIRRWPTVLEGEQKNIYPFQDEVDATFNSALLYELAVLKNMLCTCYLRFLQRTMFMAGQRSCWHSVGISRPLLMKRIFRIPPFCGNLLAVPVLM